MSTEIENIKSEERTGATEKFFFNLNNFNDDYVEEPEEEIPPPPTFSEEELADAQAEAFAKGRQAGLDEAAASREKAVADLLAVIAKNYDTLFSAEDERNRLFEHETLHLALTIFKKIFPTLNANHGLAEIESVLEKIIHSQTAPSKINIEVMPEHCESLQTYIDEALKLSETSGLCTVAGNENLGPGDCLLRWDNGGAHRSATALSQQISEHLEQALAGNPRLSDNEEDVTSETDADSAVSSEQTKTDDEADDSTTDNQNDLAPPSSGEEPEGNDEQTHGDEP